MPLHMAEHGMPDGGLTELARHGDVLGVVEVLVAEEDHLPLEEGIPHRLHLVRRQPAGQVDAADFRADVKGQGYDVDGT